MSEWQNGIWKFIFLLTPPCPPLAKRGKKINFILIFSFHEKENIKEV